MISFRRPTVFNALLFCILSFGVGNPASATVLVGGKHLVIVKPGLDALWGNYIFAVENDTDADEMAMVPVMLPKEAVDYRAHEGIEPSDIRLREDGIAIEKSFAPGQHIISLGFLVDVSLGQTTLTFDPPGDIPDFTLLLPANGLLKVAGGPLAASENTPDPSYIAFQGSSTFVKGEVVTVNIGGVPEGRLRYWIIGGIVGSLLLLVAGFFAWRSRPKFTAHTDETMILADA